jgi:hypothetical protein
MGQPMATTIFKLKRFRIQTGRGDRAFAWEWIEDMLSDDLMVASVTVFGISFVWLGTAY